MNTLRRLSTTLVALVALLLAASPAMAVINASPIVAGQSSGTSIFVCTTDTPSFSAVPPGGVDLGVSFSAPVSGATENCASRWTTTMTISTTTSTPADTYSFPLTVTGSGGGTLLTDTVVVVVSAAPGTTTSTTTSTTSTTTTTTAPPPTTSATTTPTTTTTTTSTTTTTTVPPTTTSTTTSSTTTTSTSTSTTTTVPPTTTSTTLAAIAAEEPPGAAFDPESGLPLNVVLPLGAGLLLIIGVGVLLAGRRRGITPARKGQFSE